VFCLGGLFFFGFGWFVFSTARPFVGSTAKLVPPLLLPFFAHFKQPTGGLGFVGRSSAKAVCFGSFLSSRRVLPSGLCLLVILLAGTPAVLPPLLPL
jgi:hypothetical protein